MGKENNILIACIAPFIIDKERRSGFKNKYLKYDTCPNPPYGLLLKRAIIRCVTALIPIAALRRRLRRRLMWTPLPAPWLHLPCAGGSVTILAPTQNIYAAEAIRKNLSRAGIHAGIIHKRPLRWGKGFYFIVSPSSYVLHSLPKHYAIVHTEHIADKEWYGPQYRDMLKNADALLDYSTDNIQVVRNLPEAFKIPFSRIFYLPLSIDKEELCNIPDEERPYDVAVWGAPSRPAHKQLIETLCDRYKVKLLSERDSDHELGKAKIYLDLHIAENGLLESSLIHEALCAGALVVAAKPDNMEEYESLRPLATWTDATVIDLQEAVENLLADKDARKELAAERRAECALAKDWTAYYLLRFLLAYDSVTFDVFHRYAADVVDLKKDHVCLGLPESRERVEYVFNTPEYLRFQYFPGLRHHEGWIGCGLSYKFILAKALQTDYPTLTIAEDDVEFPEGWEKRMELVMEYLQRPECGDWHVMSGLIMEVNSQAACSAVRRYKGERYVHINKLVSTVLNVYNRSIFKVMAEWDPDEPNPVGLNQIDRHIEKQPGLSVVVPVPYLFGHLDSVESTLWLRSNGSLYNGMYQCSLRRIKELADSWEAQNGLTELS